MLVLLIMMTMVMTMKDRSMLSSELVLDWVYITSGRAIVRLAGRVWTVLALECTAYSIDIVLSCLV